MALHAEEERAFAERPYTVSVGKATGRSCRRAEDASRSEEVVVGPAAARRARRSGLLEEEGSLNVTKSESVGRTMVSKVRSGYAGAEEDDDDDDASPSRAFVAMLAILSAGTRRSRVYGVFSSSELDNLVAMQSRARCVIG